MVKPRAAVLVALLAAAVTARAQDDPPRQDAARRDAVAKLSRLWRVTVPNKTAEGPYFEHPKTIQGTDDLWCYDPKDGAVVRLTDRGFTARSWDIRETPTPTAPRSK